MFEPIEGENLVKIAELMLGDLQTNLLKKNINISFGEGLAKKVASDGFDIEFGARPMRRVVDLVLVDVLGKAIIENKILPGDKIELIPGEGKDEYGWKKI